MSLTSSSIVDPQVMDSLFEYMTFISGLELLIEDTLITALPFHKISVFSKYKTGI